MDHSIESLPNFNQLPTSINLNAMAELPILSPSSQNANLHTLPALPNELLIMITEYLSYHDMNALLRTNRRLAFLLASILRDCLEKELQAGGGPAALVQAAKSLHVSKLRLLVEVYHIDPNCIVVDTEKQQQEDWFPLWRLGDIPLVCLFRSDHSQSSNDLVTEAVEILVRNGARVDVRDCNLCPVLWLSMVCQNIEATRLLLEHGASPFCEERHGEHIPLQYAVEKHMPDFCKLFIKYSSDPGSYVNDSGQTLLHLAAESTSQSSSAVVKILFENGLQNQVSVYDYNGNCPLHTACRNFEWNSDAEERIAILLEYGADPNARMKEPHLARWPHRYPPQSFEGYMPLHLVAMGNPRGPIISRVIRNLVEKGANIHATIPHISRILRTPLALVVEKLVHFNLARRTHESLAPGFFATGNRNLIIEGRIESRIDVMATLLELGADIEAAHKVLQTWFVGPCLHNDVDECADVAPSVADTKAALNAAVKLARERVLGVM